MAIPLSYSIRGLWTRRSTTLATAIGIALVVFVLASSQMLAAGLRGTLLKAGSTDKAIVLQVDGFSEGGSRLKQSALTRVAASPGMRLAEDGQPLLVGESVVHVYLGQSGNSAQHASVQVRGATPMSYKLRPEVHILAGRPARPGTNEAIVGRSLEGDYEGLRLGNGFELHKNQRLEIVGVFAAQGSAYESEVWGDLDVVRGAFDAQGYLSSVTAWLESPASYEAFKLSVEQDKREGLSVERQTAYYEKVSNNLARVISGLGTVVTFIFSFGAMLGAMITIHAAASQRRRELRVMRALGFQGWHILMIILLESLLVAASGGLLGVALALLTPFIEISTVNWATHQELAFRFSPNAMILVSALFSGVTVGLLGGLVPALRAARETPITALRA